MFSPIKYDEPIFRPPSESQSLLIQLTLGCSNNRCTYCAMYSTKKFMIRDIAQIKLEIDIVKQMYHQAGSSGPGKVFLCDGDALVAPTELLLDVVEYLNKSFPGLRRVGIYCTAENILNKSVKDLTELAKIGLNMGYLGLESGSDDVLKMVKKGNSKNDMIEASNKIMSAGFKLSVIAMLGLGGTKLSSEHVRESAEVISKSVPNFFSFLTTVPISGTPYFKSTKKGEISPLTSKQLLQEMYDIISMIKIDSGNIIFRANHVSNAHPLGGTLPRDTHKLLSTIKQWINLAPEGTYPTFPEYL